MYQSAYELAFLVRTRAISPLEAMEATISRIEAINPLINAFTNTCFETALKEAKSQTERIANGADLGPLAGVPIGVKDLEDAAGLVTSYGSTPFKDNVAREDSVQVARLKSAGAIVVGKTNTPEFGFTGFTKNRLFGTTKNPWDMERTPGGSSGGSAAAIAAKMVPLATGSDAGGSIRIPACYCGCFGIKPTYGRIPLGPRNSPYIGQIWTLGPLTRTVMDAALYLDCTTGPDPMDPDSLLAPDPSYLTCLQQPAGKLKLGFSPHLGYAQVQKDVMALSKKALTVFEDMGHEVEIWDGLLPDVGDAWSDLMAIDLYSQLKDGLDSFRPDLGRTLVAAIDRVRKLSLDNYIEQHKMRCQLQLKLADFFSGHDLLLTPAMPTEAFDANGPPPGEIDGVPIPLLGAVAFTYPFNILGNPAASVRTGLTPSGLPAGLQIVGPKLRDDLVLQLAHDFEQASPWNDQWPLISSG